MASPRFSRHVQCIAETCSFKQYISQPYCVIGLKVERLAKYLSLILAARVRPAKAIVLNLPDIEDRLITLRQTRRHVSTHVLQLVWHIGYTAKTFLFNSEVPPSASDNSGY
jgi:hypothetical protein